MGDDLQKVKPGQKLRMPAKAYNAFIDAARAVQGRQWDQGRDAMLAPGRSADIVMVKNATGTAQGRFAVLGVSAPIYTPTDNVESFKNAVAILGLVPTAADHMGKFIVLLEPAAVNAIVRGVIAGVTPVKVNFGDTEDKFADVEDGVAARLKSGNVGMAQVLWKEAGTGVKWAIVRIGGSAPETDFWGWGRIAGSSEASANIYSYTMIEQEGGTPGTMQDAQGARTVAARNSAEIGNSSTGLQGNGANLANYPAGTKIRPLVTGRRYRVYQQEDCNGDPRYWITGENGMPEECAGGS